MRRLRRRVCKIACLLAAHCNPYGALCCLLWDIIWRRDNAMAAVTNLTLLARRQLGDTFCRMYLISSSRILASLMTLTVRGCLIYSPFSHLEALTLCTLVWLYSPWDPRVTLFRALSIDSSPVCKCAPTSGEQRSNSSWPSTTIKHCMVVWFPLPLISAATAHRHQLACACFGVSSSPPTRCRVAQPICSCIYGGTCRTPYGVGHWFPLP